MTISQETGDVITLTTGGNDLLKFFYSGEDLDRYPSEGIEEFAGKHFTLLKSIRRNNPRSIIIIGNVYYPDFELKEIEEEILRSANQRIASNVSEVGVHLADIYKAFRGNESEYLCHYIEPTYEGATVISALFYECYRRS